MDLRRLCSKTALAAPAEQVLVRIDEAWSHQTSARVDDVDLEAHVLDCIAVDVAHDSDLPVYEKYRLLSEVFRRVDVAVFDQGQHTSAISQTAGHSAEMAAVTVTQERTAQQRSTSAHATRRYIRISDSA